MMKQFLPLGDLHCVVRPPADGVVVVLRGNRDILLVQDSEQQGRLPLVSELPFLDELLLRQNRQLLALGMFTGGNAVFGVDFSTDESGTELAECNSALSWHEFRRGCGLLAAGELSGAMRGKILLRWKAARQFCGVCGEVLETLAGEEAMRCPACGMRFYPKISPAVIVGVRRDDTLLLAHNSHFSDNIYGLIAGFVEAGESAEETVRREIREEVNIEVDNIRYFGSQSWPFPDSLMLGFWADYAGGDLRVDGSEITDADFFHVSDFPNIPYKGSIARRMIECYIADASLKSGK